MQIDQWELMKAIFNGFANVFLNPRIMISFIIAMIVIFLMKRAFKRFELRMKALKK